MNKPLLRPLTSGNIAAVEPYHHVPSTTPGESLQEEFQKTHLLVSRQSSGQYPPQKPERESKDPYLNRRSQHLEPVGSEQIYNHERLSQDDFNMKIAAQKNQQVVPNQNLPEDSYKIKDDRGELVESLPEFGASKFDSKYQTLPYNTKFTVNYVTHPNSHLGVTNMISQRRPPGEGGEHVCDPIELVKNNNNSVNQVNNNMTQQQLMNVVHSIPIPTSVNKGLATPLANQSKLSPSMMSSSSSTSSTSSLSLLGNLGPR